MKLGQLRKLLPFAAIALFGAVPVASSAMAKASFYPACSRELPVGTCCDTGFVDSDGKPIIICSN